MIPPYGSLFPESLFIGLIFISVTEKDEKVLSILKTIRPTIIMITSKSKIAVHNKESDQHRYDKDITTNDGKTFVRTTHKFIDNKLKLNEPILIAGFPGPGLVGSISTNYIIDKLNMHQIACIESPFIIPGVIYTGGKRTSI